MILNSFSIIEQDVAVTRRGKIYMSVDNIHFTHLVGVGIVQYVKYNDSNSLNDAREWKKPLNLSLSAVARYNNNNNII